LCCCSFCGNRILQKHTRFFIHYTVHVRRKKNRHQASLMHRNGTGGMQRSCSVQTNIHFTNFIRISIQISTDASFQQLASASSCNQHLCRPQPVAVGGRYSISAHFRSLPVPPDSRTYGPASESTFSPSVSTFEACWLPRSCVWQHHMLDTTMDPISSRAPHAMRGLWPGGVLVW
jgi:hypothetical protein